MTEKITKGFLGDFGDEVEDIDLYFGYFGETIRVHPMAGELTYMDFMSKASEIDEADQAAGVNLTMEFLKNQIHPDDWEAFWNLARSHRQNLEALMRVSKAIVEQVAGFPTGPPSGSPGGRQPTARKSKAASSKRATGQRAIESVNPTILTTPAEGTAMEVLTGRPDLQLIIQKAQDHRLSNGADALGGVLQGA